MKEIAELFDKDIFKVLDNEYYHYEVTDGYVHYLFVAPHRGNNNRWMMRVAAEATFDRWANSTVIEESFDSESDVVSYLQRSQIYILKKIIESLSEEYGELEFEYRINCY